MFGTFVDAFNVKGTYLPWTTSTPYLHVGPILLASSSGGLLEVALDDMSLFPSESWDAEDKVILGCVSRLFGLSLLVLGNYPPRHGLWALVESGPSRKFSSPYKNLKYRTIEPGYYNFSKAVTTWKFKPVQIKINLIYGLIN